MITIDDIRAAVKSLRGRRVLPKQGSFYGITRPPEIRDGIVWIGICAIHPFSFLDVFGVRKFRSIKRDVSKEKIEKCIKAWKKKRK